MIEDQNHYVETDCLSCGQSFEGNYCSNCGEKKVKPEEHTLKFFLGQLISALTFADTKVWKTMRFLFVKPGKLPSDFIKGKRKPYIAPLPLFLLANILYFLLSPVDTFNSYYTSQIKGQPYSGFIKEYAHQKIIDSGMEEQAFITKYNTSSSNISKTIILLIPILLAFPITLLYSKKDYYFFDHLMFSISYMTYILLGIFLLLFYVMYGTLSIILTAGYTVDFDFNGPTSMGILLLALSGYLVVAVKNFYQQSWLLTVVKSLVILFSIIFSVLVYRFILFFITMWMM